MRQICDQIILIVMVLGLVACEQAADDPELITSPMVLDYNFGATRLSFDPVFVVNSVSLDINAQLFDPLIRFDSKSRQIIPALAEDWDVSQDGLTYTFKIREDAFWVNQAGEAQRQVTASDVVYGIRRACHPEVGSPYSHILFTIRGCQEVNESELPDLERIEVQELAPFIVEFRLVEPIAYFPITLTMPVARPIPQDVVEANGKQWTEPEHILTNGPYLLNEWQPDDRITLIKNEHYYQAKEFQIMRINGYFLDEVAASKLYLTNQLDSINLAATETRHLHSMSGLAKESTRIPEPCTYAYGFTLVKPPLDNVRVRRALSMALDRQELIDNVQGSQLAARHFAPPFVFGALSLDSEVSFDLQMAKKLLAEAGYPDGQGIPPLSLWHPDNELQAQFAAAASEMWKVNLGIEVIVESLPRENYLTLMQRTTPLNEISHIWALGWCADYPDQHNWIYKVFNLNAEPLAKPPANSRFKDRITVYGGGKYIRRVSSTFEELTDQAITERDPEKRQTFYEEAERILTVEETMIIPVYHYTINAFTKPWLQRTFSYVGDQSFKNWTIDMAAKEAARSRDQ